MTSVGFLQYNYNNDEVDFPCTQTRGKENIYEV